MLRILLALSAAGCAASGYRALPPGPQVPNTVTTEVRNAAGVRIGTSTTVIGYRPAVTDYRLVRGGVAIDEQDFYHLAGDAEAVAKIEAERARLRRNNRIGRIILAVSAVGAVAFPITIDGLGGTALGIGSVLLIAPIGGVLTAVNHNKVNAKKLGSRRAFTAIGRAPPGWAR